MWDVIVSVPDHCLSFYFSNSSDRIESSEYTQMTVQCSMILLSQINIHSITSACKILNAFILK